MPNDAKTILDLENQIVVELGFSMATVAERMLRHPDRLQAARSEAERVYIRRETARILERLIRTSEVAFAVLDDYRPFFKKGNIMWKSIGLKFLHAIVPAVGAAVAAIVPALGIPVALKVAIGAAVGYLVKPARPADQNAQ